MPEYWIQLHDYTSATHDNASPNQTKTAFKTFDWASEREKHDENDPEMNCPPGIGISNGIPMTEHGAILLHVCPLDSSTTFLNIHCSRSAKLFGIFPRVKQITNYVNPIDSSRVDALIDLVFAGDSEALLAIE